MRSAQRMRAPLVSVAACAVSLLALAVSASADNGPHVQGAGLTTDTCAACHRAHTARAPYLLKSNEETLCYTCHGSSATGASTDVADGVGFSNPERGGPAKPLRGGGFKYALIDSAHPSGNGYIGEIPVRATGAPVTSTHSVDSSEQMAWGNGPISATINYGTEIPLRCGSCHDPHGNGNYRILRPIPKESGATSGVTIADATTKVYTTENYWDVEDENSPAFILNISAWCSTCHTRYLAGGGSGHTNSGDAVFTYRHRTNETSQGTPNCIQCHVAHGSNASMGTYSVAVPNPDGSPAKGTEAGADSRLLRIDNRGVCEMCHNK